MQKEKHPSSGLYGSDWPRGNLGRTVGGERLISACDGSRCPGTCDPGGVRGSALAWSLGGPPSSGPLKDSSGAGGPLDPLGYGSAQHLWEVTSFVSLFIHSFYKFSRALKGGILVSSANPGILAFTLPGTNHCLPSPTCHSGPRPRITAVAPRQGPVLALPPLPGTRTRSSPGPAGVRAQTLPPARPSRPRASSVLSRARRSPPRGGGGERGTCDSRASDPLPSALPHLPLAGPAPWGPPAPSRKARTVSGFSFRARWSGWQLFPSAAAPDSTRGNSVTAFQ